MKRNTRDLEKHVATAKIAVSVDETLLREVDRWVAAGDFPNRSRVVQAGLLSLRQARARRRRLLRELAKLNPKEEQQLAEEMLKARAPWPEY